MLKEAAGVAGGALLLPLGVPVALHGIAGILIGGAGLFVVDAVLKQVEDIIPIKSPLSEVKESDEEIAE
jgi:hypothetical protein